MDPFTQRMLERAKMRRDKLDSQKMDLEQIPSSTGSCNLNTKRKSFHKISDKENTPEEKKEKECISNMRKCKLQKLANFYSGSEEKLSLENEKNIKQDIVFNNLEKKQPPKLGRLMELATKIKQWDDDLDSQKKFCSNLKNVKGELPQVIKEERTMKKESETTWDKSLVGKLGFTASPSKSKLVYNFEKEKEQVSVGKSITNCNKNFSCKSKLSEWKTGNQSVSASKNDIFKKAAISISCSGRSTAGNEAKDPAELSLAERKALFERKSEVTFFKNSASVSKSEVGSNVKNTKCSERSPIKSNRLEENKENGEVEGGRSKSELIEVAAQARTDLKNVDEKCSNTKLDTTKKSDPFADIKLTDESIPEEKFVKSKVVSSQPPPSPGLQRVNSGASLSGNVENDEVLSPKTGRLYPSLSNLDMTMESELTSSETESLSESFSKNGNFCLNLTLSDLLDLNKNNPTTPPHEKSFSRSTDWQDTQKVNALLENSLSDSNSERENEEDIVSGPTKTMKSSSFKYSGGLNGDVSLMHTVSFYRKQQQNSHFPSEATSEMETPKNGFEGEANESILVQNKIQALIAEVNKQQTIISQASQALNLCVSTVEFSGSGEQVEGERLLLLATQKRQACLNEIQRLKIENRLWPQADDGLSPERGNVTVTDISLKLKRDAIRALAAAENLSYFVCLIKSDEQVFATCAVSATKENLKDLILSFPGQIKLEGLRSNFKVTVEVYNLELSKELLPHDIKYHIINKKEKKLLTPIKIRKGESKLIKPNVQSPAGPNAVRSSIFQMCGYIVFSLKEVARTQWILNKVPYVSPLEGTISMRIGSELRLADEFRGFLTMFDDISGFGAWHRRWCLLSSHFISYWKYPDDECKKIPNGTIDLRTVITENVGLVSRDICARLNTFLLESTRPRLPEDKNSLVLTVQNDVTTIRHLLSADSKQEMATWCKKINSTLALLRSWKCNVGE